MQLSAKSKRDFIILSILTLGILNLVYFIVYGVQEFIFKKTMNHFYIGEDSLVMSTFGKVSLVVSSVLSLGTVWLLLAVIYGFNQILFQYKVDNKKPLSFGAILSLAIASILTFGMVWVIFLVTFWYNELITNTLYKNSGADVYKSVSGIGTFSFISFFLFVFVCAVVANKALMSIGQLSFISEIDNLVIREIETLANEYHAVSILLIVTISLIFVLIGISVDLMIRQRVIATSSKEFNCLANI